MQPEEVRDANDQIDTETDRLKREWGVYKITIVGMLL